MTEVTSNVAMKTGADALKIMIRQRGQEEYSSSFAAMRAFTDARTADTPDELWIVEHLPVFTLGLGADQSHVLAPHDIPVIQTDRGGEVTFHGPGQVVIYLLIDLKRRHTKGRLFAREFVHQIEQAVIDTLAAYNIAGERIAGAPGIYLKDGEWQGAKIAALGLKVRANGCTYHGVSLNVAMDLQPFSWINPCGYEGLATIDMRTLQVQVPLEQVQTALANRLQHLLTVA
ncbi:lipoyl(octanoyl) transferase LipB [Undibacterium sp. Di24W]|uniref:lipoyl(octanoyl) transferase LipB n=1 Tax=Undibacterium sp. Di24W TaxID=3413033 RepID=UPI003BF190A6